MSKCPYCHQEVDFLTALFWEYEHWHTGCANKFLLKKKAKLEEKLSRGIESETIKLSTAKAIERELYDIVDDLRCIKKAAGMEEQQSLNMAMINSFGAKALMIKNIPLKHEKELRPGCDLNSVMAEIRAEETADLIRITGDTNDV